MYFIVSKSSEFDVKVSTGIIFTFFLATSNHATLVFHFSLAVLGSVGDKF